MSRMLHARPEIQDMLDQLIVNDKRVKTMIDIEYHIKQHPDLSADDLYHYASTSYPLPHPIEYGGQIFHSAEEFAHHIAALEDVIFKYPWILKYINLEVRHQKLDPEAFVRSMTSRFPELGWGLW